MNSAEPAPVEGPWNPGIQSQVPADLRHLQTICRPENVANSAAFTELSGLTGFGRSDLAAFRPQRLAVHELLIRVTADFAVPDGSRVGDLGINFRQIASRLHQHYVLAEMDALTAIHERARRELCDAIDAAFAAVTAAAARPVNGTRRPRAARWFAGIARRRSAAASSADRSWGPSHIAECERRAGSSATALQQIAHRTLARVMSALFATQGQTWGSRDLIVTLATDLACNDYGSDCIGRALEPVLERAARSEGFVLLPRQERPVVINTKGASASGKSTLRLLQKKLAGDIGVRWADFALISPDIWRKYLLDYASLGAAYKYAGAFTADELQIVDQKLDRYMTRKHRRGEMTHLLIDRFRFDSFAPDSDEAGSNLLTRFGAAAYLFFMITPPEMLVERAWKRGLEFGRYKAVDDTLAHAVQAYSGIPDVFFTWVRRGDKRIHFEFLDNTVRFGEPPRTVAFGDNDTCNILDVKGTLDIERYARININASSPQQLYPDATLLEPERNTAFLRRCVDGFRAINFADRDSGRIYLRMESGKAVWADQAELQAAVADPDTRCGIMSVAGAALQGDLAQAPGGPRLLDGEQAGHARTLGQWGLYPRKPQ
ncbi:MAG TPA: hypothetical protein VGE92_06660 [Steroidobacteraceae bacterium]